MHLSQALDGTVHKRSRRHYPAEDWSHARGGWTRVVGSYKSSCQSEQDQVYSEWLIKWEIILLAQLSLSISDSNQTYVPNQNLPNQTYQPNQT